ncbi:MAG: exodeoxyribonuclease VII large subunit [Clostridia bacterium]|nr:exodeoxyribonuclease VII large subunit [Clostridia bacterium]
MMYNAPLVLSVSQLNRYVKSRMDADENLFNVFLVGEISNFTDHYKTGHFYFSLKDEEAQIKAVMFRQNALKVKFRPENGLRVIVRGRVSLYEAAGSYQIFVDDMQPDGVGALNLAFEQLKERLEKEGLFDAAHKKPLPRFPERIGVITSETGAAVQDILNILGRRFPYAQVVLAPVLVQGEGAPAQLIDALQTFNTLKNVDVIILGRGGGSAEDLWAFNDELLAYAVYRSQIPVISAVGHETDFTICDFVADLRAPTPSAAAELAVPDQTQLRAEIHTLLSRMQRTVTNNLREQRLQLERFTQKSLLKNPNLYFDTKRMQLLSVSTQFDALEKEILHRARVRLQENAAKLQALSPLSVLARGYSVTTLADGTVVKSANQLSENTEITVQLADGKAACTVKEIL